MLRYILLLVGFVFSLLLLAQKPLQPNSQYQLIEHQYYTLEYSPEKKQAVWVCYELTPANLNGQAKRKNNFREDELVKEGKSTLNDYKKSGYDRGHLCPAADMKINQEAMDETFYLSNMSPQLPALNRGKWKDLEEQVRKWAGLEKNIMVVTGPVFDPDLGSIGNDVCIPGAYYKAILDLSDSLKMIGFILPNADCEEALSAYRVSVDSIEERIGRDLFASLPDSLEAVLESEESKWSYDVVAADSALQMEPHLCGAVLLNGDTCHMKNWSINGLCYLHQPQMQIKENPDDRCQAITRKGERCKRKVKKGTKYCWMHQQKE